MPLPETVSSASCARRGGRLRPRCPPGRDYVLVARSGLAEPADTRGQAWLLEQLTDVLGKAAA